MTDKLPKIIVRTHEVESRIIQIEHNDPCVRRIEFPMLTIEEFVKLAEAFKINTHVYELRAPITTLYPLPSRVEEQLYNIMAAINKRLKQNLAAHSVRPLSFFAAKVVAETDRTQAKALDVPAECREKIQEAINDLDAPDLSLHCESGGRRFL